MRVSQRNGPPRGLFLNASLFKPGRHGLASSSKKVTASYGVDGRNTEVINGRGRKVTDGTIGASHLPALERAV